MYKSLSISILVLFVGGFGIVFFGPSEPIDLGFLQFHSQSVSTALDQSRGLERLFFFFAWVFTEMNLIGLVFASIIASIWFWYIRKLDFFKKEKRGNMTAVFLFGGVMTFFTILLSDFIHEALDLEYEGSRIYKLFAFSFVGIGVIEELVKLLPVLLLIAFSNQIEEVFDLVIYSCLSALGFSFIENLIYFRDLTGDIVISRALMSSAGHMIMSTFVVYGLALYLFRGRHWINIPWYFTIGSMTHALYDFFLFEELIFFFNPFFIFIVQSWIIIINNAINNAKQFSYRIVSEHEKVRYILPVSFSLLLLLSLVVNTMLVGRKEAFVDYVFSVFWTFVMVFFFSSGLSSFDLIKGYWRPIKFTFSRPSNEALPGARGLSIFRHLFLENIIIPLNHIGRKLKIHAPFNNDYLNEIFHMGTGKIVNRTYLIREGGEREYNWFIVKLDTPMDVNSDYFNNHILVQLRNPLSNFDHDENIEAWVLMIPKDKNPNEDHEFESYLPYGIIILNGIDYQWNLSYA